MRSKEVTRTGGDDAGGMRTPPSRSFEEFFRHEYEGLVRLLFVLTRDLAEAEDLAQEAMARALERWFKVSQMTSPGGYVYRTALNIQRKRHRHQSAKTRALFGSRPLLVSQVSVEEGVELSLVLSGLPRRDREALILVDWYGLAAEEAAEVLGIAAGSVRARVRRARQRLRSVEGIDDE